MNTRVFRFCWLRWAAVTSLYVVSQVHAAGNQAQLVLVADTACLLKVDGRSMGALSPGIERTVALNPGAVEVVCERKDGGMASARERVVLRAGETASARLRLRWTVSPDGVLDNAQRLVWSRQDNGVDIDSPGAIAWCESMGKGWRLPSRAELESLSSGAAGETTPCRGAKCKAPTLFTLTSYWMWSGDHDSQGRAFYHYLHTGHTQTSQPDYRLHARALCVRPA